MSLKNLINPSTYSQSSYLNIVRFTKSIDLSLRSGQQMCWIRSLVRALSNNGKLGWMAGLSDVYRREGITILFPRMFAMFLALF